MKPTRILSTLISLVSLSTSALAIDVTKSVDVAAAPDAAWKPSAISAESRTGIRR